MIVLFQLSGPYRGRIPSRCNRDGTLSQLLPLSSQTLHIPPTLALLDRRFPLHRLGARLKLCDKDDLPRSTRACILRQPCIMITKAAFHILAVTDVVAACLHTSKNIHVVHSVDRTGVECQRHFAKDAQPVTSPSRLVSGRDALPNSSPSVRQGISGPYRGRTGDLHNAIVALSQTELTAHCFELPPKSRLWRDPQIDW